MKSRVLQAEKAPFKTVTTNMSFKIIPPTGNINQNSLLEVDYLWF